MLRITTRTDALETVFELEGRLAGAWVKELERCWHEIPADHVVRISLKAVTFIDAEGKALLTALYQSGVDLQASGCMTSCIVQEIIANTSPSSMSGETYAKRGI